MARKAQERKKGSGTLVKRGNIWFARWTVNKKVSTRTTGTSSQREAELKLEEFTAPFRLESTEATLETLTARLGGVKDAIRRNEEAKPQLNLADAWKVYEDSSKRPDSGEGTLKTYEAQYGRFVAWITKEFPEIKEVRAVTEEHAGAFASYLNKNFSPNVHNKYIVLLKRFWKVVGVAAKATANPWTEIQMKRLDTHSRRELTVEELSKVCGSVDGELRILFALGLYTGLRLGDCALLKWSNIDMVKGIISVIPSKTSRYSNKPISIPMHESLAGIIMEAHSKTSKGFIMPELAAWYLQDAPGVTRKIKAVFEAQGIECNSTTAKRKRQSVDVGFHSLRHSFVSLCANGGVPLAIVQSIVGHSNPSMTLHYYHADSGAVKGAIDSLPSLGAVDALPDVMGGIVPEVAKDSTDAKLDAFAALVDGMTNDELKRAKAYIKTKKGKNI